MSSIINLSPFLSPFLSGKCRNFDLTICTCRWRWRRRWWSNI